MVRSRNHKGSEQFSDWLKISMENVRLTGNEVAAKINVDGGTVSRWKNGKATPNMEAVASLADLFGVNALRLAVTAGLVTKEVAGVEPLEMPENKAILRQAKEYVWKIPGLKTEDREAMMKVIQERYGA